MITQPRHKLATYSVTIFVMLALTACGSQPDRAPDRPHREVAKASKALSIGERAAAFAVQQVGVPYRYGGNSTSGFDCSGLVQYSYARAGKTVPRTTGQLWSATTPVSHTELQPGDLLFFSIEGKMSHVGIYVGDRQFVHAPSSGRTVTVASMDSPFYSAALLRTARVR